MPCSTVRRNYTQVTLQTNKAKHEHPGNNNPLKLLNGQSLAAGLACYENCLGSGMQEDCLFDDIFVRGNCGP